MTATVEIVQEEQVKEYHQMEYIIAGDPQEVGQVMETVVKGHFLSDWENVEKWDMRPLTEGVIYATVTTKNEVSLSDLQLITSEYTSLTIGVADDDGFVESVVAEGATEVVSD